MGRGLLIFVSGLTIIFGIVQMSLVERQQAVLPERSTHYANEQQARNISNSLMEAVVRQLETDKNWSIPNDGSVEVPPEVAGGDSWIKVYDENSSNLPSDHSAGDQSDWGKYKLLIVTQAEVNGYKSQTEATMVRDSFSKYSYFTNVEPDYIWFFSGDVLNGPVHTNGTFHIAGNPQFNGMVTSPNDWEGHPSYNNDPQFNGGSDFNSDTKTTPDQYQMDELRAAAASSGLQFNDDISIEMTYDEGSNTGTLEITSTSGPWWNPSTTTTTLTEAEYNKRAISTSGKIKIEGTLKGQLTVHSEDEVEIMGDVEYARPPSDDPESTDMLGIVSEGDVNVDKDAHSANGSSDININASIMALDESFSVEDYNYDSPRGTINLLGGIIQQERGAVGTFRNGSVYTGYSKDYSYDDRLLGMNPPHFPRESVFSYGYWKDKIVERPSSSI